MKTVRPVILAALVIGMLGRAAAASAQAAAQCPDEIAVAPKLVSAAGLEAIQKDVAQRSWTKADRTPRFLEATYEPESTNRDLVARRIVERYPVALRNSGVGGTVGLRLLIDGEGRVEKAAVLTGSGHGELDRLARESARIMRFAPYKNGGCALPLVLDVPISFTAR